jgi:VWFA-related protein
MLKNLLLSFFFILCFVTLAYSQNNPSQEEDKTIRIDTELIQLDVVVTDKDGKVVDKLKQEDFEITEDGKKQSIEFFSFVHPEIKENIPNKTLSKPDRKTNIDVSLIEQSGRVFIVLVDDLHISPANMSNVKKQLFQLIDNQIQDGDRVSVVTTGGGLGFLQQLTDERKVYRKAVEKLIGKQQAFALPGDLAMLTEYQAQKINEGERDVLEFAVATYLKNLGTQVPVEGVRNMIRATSRQIVADIAFKTTSTLQTIRNAILSVKSIPGRKTMILVSDGFLLESRDADHYAQMKRITDSATKSGVVVYSLGSAGLVVGTANSPFDITSNVFDGRGLTLSLSSRELGDSVVGLQKIAQDTGGFSIINNNNLLGALGNIVTESSSYYLLAYYPENSTKDGNFREIKVSLKDGKKLTVKTRQGYFAGGDKTEQEEAAKKVKDKSKKPEQADITNTELLDSLGSVLPVKDVRLKMKADFLGPIDASKNNSVFSFAIDLRDIKFNKSEDHRYINKLNTLLMIFGEDGKIIESNANAIDLNFPSDRYEKLSRSNIFYAKSLNLKPGFYNVRFALRDPVSNRLGSVSGWIEVPNLEKSKMTLSNILLLQSDTSEMLDAQKVTGSGQALTTFSEKSSLGFLCYIFNAKANKLSVQIEIIKANKALFTSPQINIDEKVDSDGRRTYGGSLSLAGFPQGDYRLKITVTDSKNKLQAFQEQKFTIEK